MFRFHDFNKNFLPDFWKNYYAHTDLITLHSFIGTILASKSGGYDLLQSFDILNIGEHIPGNIITWEELPLAFYLYDATAAYPHSYIIPDNILSIQNLYDATADPTISLQNNIDFVVSEDWPGIIRLVKDIPIRPLLVHSGVVGGQPINIDAYRTMSPITYDFKITDDYPYQYRIATSDGIWERIDSLEVNYGTDSSIMYYDNVDFIYDSATSIISFKLKVPTIPMFISKGTIVGTRLDDDYGDLFSYDRYDSTWYRDSMVALMSLFFTGPTYANMLAAANVAFHFPVAKYGGETVTATSSNSIKTSMYQYNLNDAVSKLAPGDSISYNQPVTSAFTLDTQRTNPQWWIGRVPGLFQKYAIEPLDEIRKNTMMEAFLKSYLGHLRLHLQNVDTFALQQQLDLWDIFEQGWPIRTDLIMSAYYSYGPDRMTYPAYDKVILKNKITSSWCQKEQIPSSSYFNIVAKNTVRNVILPDPTKNTKNTHGFKDWSIGSNRYRINGANEQFKQLWDKDRVQLPYVEPCTDRVWYRAVSTTTIKASDMKIVDNSLAIPTDIYTKLDSTLKDQDLDSDSSTETNLSIITNSMNDTITSSLSIASEIYYDLYAFKTWTNNGLWLSKYGFVCPIGGEGSITSPFVNLGIIPKSIKIEVGVTLPVGCSFTVEYSPDGINFTVITSGEILINITGNICTRISLKANSYSYPTLNSVAYVVKH